MAASRGASTFSRHHYAWIAAHMKERRVYYTRDHYAGECLAWCAAFKRDHTGFVTVRFLQACGYTRAEAEALLSGDTQHAA